MYQTSVFQKLTMWYNHYFNESMRIMHCLATKLCLDTFGPAFAPGCGARYRHFSLDAAGTVPGWESGVRTYWQGVGVTKVRGACEVT